MHGEKVEKFNLDLLSLARRARPLRAEFLSRGNLHKFICEILYNLPIVIYPEMGYTYYRDKERGSPL